MNLLEQSVDKELLSFVFTPDNMEEYVLSGTLVKDNSSLSI
jgi:hypothetical protein